MFTSALQQPRGVEKHRRKEPRAAQRGQARKQQTMGRNLGLEQNQMCLLAQSPSTFTLILTPQVQGLQGDLGPDLHAQQQLPTDFPGFQAYPCGSAPGPPPHPLLPPYIRFVPLLGFTGCCGVVSRGWTCRESALSPPAPLAAGLRYRSSTARRFMAGRNTICLHSRLYGKCITLLKKIILQNVYILLMPRV